MLLERLTDYYGICGAEEAAFINKRVESYSEMAQEELFDLITSDNGKRFGFPDLQHLKKAFAQIAPDGTKGPRIYYWRVCRKCKSAFWSNLMYCPECHRKGDDHMEADCARSSMAPVNVIRFNKSYLKDTVHNPPETTCYDCGFNSTGHCPSFGNSKFDCLKRTVCPCNECCMKAMER